MSILEKIHGHQDLVVLNAQQRRELCGEIREFLVDHVSQTGGHMSSNLGVVELTVAIETVYDTAKDRLVFDVGHQSYVHKLLTGRQAGFHSLRQFGGMAGFPKPGESISDSFVAGHASSSVSIALGMARARHLTGQDYHVVALMGDGAASGGMAYEGLNDAAVSNEPMVVILNDNTLSIDKNVGGMAAHLRKLRNKKNYQDTKRNVRKFLAHIPGGHGIEKILRSVKGKVHRMLLPSTIFESMGFYYLGPVDGHDTEHLISLLEIARDMKKPVVLHVVTQKGKGYAPAEEHPKLFHGIGKFNPETGEPLQGGKQTFSGAFGDAMMKLAETEPKLCAITAAMPGGTGLLDFKFKYPDRLFDVGIAEEHAMSMAGGLAKQGAIPVIALYSTFLQRAYDMILQDICMLRQHVVIAVDRAGLVGEDGETHHGIFDVGFLREAPGLTILTPGSCKELQDMLVWAVKEQSVPIAIRYPRGGDRDYTASAFRNANGQPQWVYRHREGGDLTLITYGTLLQNAMDAAELLSKQGVQAGVIRLLKVQSLPTQEILVQLDGVSHVVILEEVSSNCGIRESLAWEIQHQMPHIRVDGLDLGKEYVTHGSVDKLYDSCGLSPEKIANYIQEIRHNED